MPPKNSKAGKASAKKATVKKTTAKNTTGTKAAAAEEVVAKPAIISDASDGEMSEIAQSDGERSAAGNDFDFLPLDLKKQVESLKTPDEFKGFLAQMGKDHDSELDKLRQRVELMEKFFGPTFHLFPRFPKEIQLLIWDQACNNERILAIKGYPTEEEGPYFRMFSSLPAVLHACRDSRHQGLKVYEFCDSLGKNYIDFSSDTIYIDGETFEMSHNDPYGLMDIPEEYIRTFVEPELFEKVRSIAFDLDLWFGHETDMLHLFNEYPNIDSMTLVKRKGALYQKDCNKQIPEEKSSKEPKFVELAENEAVWKGQDILSMRNGDEETEHTCESLIDAVDLLFCIAVNEKEEDEDVYFPDYVDVKGLIMGTEVLARHEKEWALHAFTG